MRSRCGSALTSSNGPRKRAQSHAAVHRLRQGRRHDRRMVGDAAPRFSDNIAGPPALPRARQRATTNASARLRDEVDLASAKLGRRLTFLVAKPGLDGHSNGAEQIAIRARDAGMSVIYNGIRFTADEIVAAAREQAPHVIGLSILSGSHVPLAAEVVAKLSEAGLSDVKVVAGRHHSARRRSTAESVGRVGGFQPQGLRSERDHARDRHAGGE